MGDPFTFDSRVTAADASLDKTGAADGVTLYQPRALEPGEIIGHYRIEGPLGQGGAGAAYSARNIDDEDERVAVKLIRPDRRDRARLVRLLRAEAAALRRVKHEGIVQYRTFKRIPNSDEYYLVTEHIDGPTLGACLQAQAFSATQVRELAARVSDALETAHEQGVIHRDLSPDNIILPAGDPRLATLIDFGIAKQGAVDPLGMDFVGKLAFAAPEQFAGDPARIGPWTDLYSLGLVLAAAARGRRLDMGHDFDSAMEARRTVLDLADVPTELRRPITRLLAPDPEARIRSAAAAAALFAPIASDETVMAPVDEQTILAPATARRLAEMARAPAPRPRSYLGWVAAAAAVLIAVVAYLVINRPPDAIVAAPASATPSARPPAPVPATKAAPQPKLDAKVAAAAAAGRNAAALARTAEAQALFAARAAEIVVAEAIKSAEAGADAAEKGRAAAASACGVAKPGMACKTLPDGSWQAGEQSCAGSDCVWDGYVALIAGDVRFEGLMDHGRYKLGQLTGTDGSVYSGAFAGMMPSGQGRMVARDGETLIGAFAAGQITGLGQLVFAETDVTRRLSYTGRFHAGMKDGPGVFAWRSGLELRGSFNRDSLTGYAVESGGGTLRREAQYQGWYSTVGVALYNDGSRYEGAFGVHDFEEDAPELRNGYGVLYGPDGAIEGQGLWIDDKLGQPPK